MVNRSSRPRPWRIFLPTLVLVVIAAGWSVLWFYAAGKAEEELDRAIAREARQGREISCANRTIEGYPFRLELRCADPVMTTTIDGAPATIKAQGFAAVAQLPNPTHLIVEVAGPVTIGAQPDTPELRLAFDYARASLHGALRGLDRPTLDRLSVEIANPVLTDASQTAGPPALKAQDLELHLRRTPGGAVGTYDLVARLDRAEGALVEAGGLGSEPAEFELQMSLSAADQLAPRPTPERLRAFAEAGGKLHLALLRARQGEVHAEAKGDLSLDTAGRPNGTLAITVAGADKVLALASAQGAGGLWTKGLKALGRPTKLADKPAATYAVSFSGGRVAVGPLPVGSLPPLF